MVVRILPYETASLFEKSSLCPSQHIKQVSDELMWIWQNIPCAGMAAPQYGKNYACFVAQGKLFINVTEIELIGVPHQKTEGCFSCAGWHTVRRYPEVKVRIGKEVTHYTGYIAQVIQHEYDHTQGILINNKE